MKIAVVGARGFLGSRLCRGLNEAGDDIIEYSSRDNKTFAEDTGLLLPAFSFEENTDCVVYLSQSPFHRQLPEYARHVWNVNVTSAIEAARCAVDAGVKRFIYASTGNVFASSFLPLKETSPLRNDDWYALSKIQAEQAIALFQDKMEIIIIRLFTLYGPGQKKRLIPDLINKIRTKKTVFLEPRPGNPADEEGLVLSLCFVEDAVKIITSLVQKGGPKYLSVASSEALSIRRISCMIGEHLGMEPVFEKSENFRRGDLIADIDTLNKWMAPAFTSFATGITKTLEKGYL